MMNTKTKKITDNEIFRSSILSFGVKVSVAGTGFLFNVMVSRYLGPQQAGLFFLCQAIVLFLANISRLGFDNAIVRFSAGYFIVKDFENVNKVFLYTILRVFGFGSVIYLILNYFSHWIASVLFDKPEVESILKVASFCIIPISLSYLISFFFQSRKNVVSAMIYQAGLLVIFSLCSFFIIRPVDAYHAILIYVIVSMVVFFISIFHWVRISKFRIVFGDFSDKKLFLKVSGSLFLVTIMSELTQWSGQFILGVFSSSQDVALFSACLRTAMLTSFILIAVNSIAAPKFAEAYKLGDHEKIKNIAIFSGRLMTISASPVLMLILIFSPYVLSLFGQQFVEASSALRILSVGQFVNVITGSVGYLLQMTGNEKILRNNLFFSMILLFVLLILLVPHMGVNGAAIATAVSISTQNLLCVYQVKRILGFNTLALWKC